MEVPGFYMKSKKLTVPSMGWMCQLITEAGRWLSVSPEFRLMFLSSQDWTLASSNIDLPVPPRKVHVCPCISLSPAINKSQSGVTEGVIGVILLASMCHKNLKAAELQPRQNFEYAKFYCHIGWEAGFTLKKSADDETAWYSIMQRFWVWNVAC